MKKWIDGQIVDMTAEEIAALQEKTARYAAEEAHRPYTLSEVQELLVKTQINTLSVDDQTACRMRAFYPEWAEGQSYPAGYRLTCGGELYRVLQAHTSQAEWSPGVGAESLYTRIDEQHDGSKYDPIPYSGNMELTAGLYYAQDGVTYCCTRDTGNPVYQPLSELAGVYVEA